MDKPPADAAPALLQRVQIKMIRISPSPTADTRTCDFANVAKDTLLASSHQPIETADKDGPPLPTGEP